MTRERIIEIATNHLNACKFLSTYIAQFDALLESEKGKQWQAIIYREQAIIRLLQILPHVPYPKVTIEVLSIKPWDKVDRLDKLSLTKMYNEQLALRDLLAEIEKEEEK